MMPSENQNNQQSIEVDKAVEPSRSVSLANTKGGDITEQSAKYRARYLALEELLEYAAESGKLDPPELAMEVKQLKKVLFYTPPETLNFEELCETEAKLERLYTTMAQLISPVCILTLRATSDTYRVQRPWWQAWFFGSNSVGRNFFQQLFWVAVLLIGLMFLREYLSLGLKKDEDFFNLVDPFLYGALGALVYLYKNLTERYINRSLHPKELSTDWLRLFMGALLGGLVVNLFSLFTTITVGDIPSMAVGFLAGYSVEFFYQILDKAIRTITPYGVQTETVVPMTPKQAQIDILTKRLKSMTNEADKAAIRRILEKL